MPSAGFHFVSHPGYLVQGLSLSQRFEAALFHYRQEAATFSDGSAPGMPAPLAG